MPASALAATAHADADTSADPDCNQCHKPHQAPTERSLLSGVTESEVCYVCHGDPLVGSDWNVETGTNSFTGMTSGHELEDATDPDATVDLTDSCTGCHGVHGDPDLRANLPANETVAGATIDPADPRSWCLACHNADHAWYSGSETAGVYSFDAGLKTAYEALIQNPERLVANGYYPTLGTFPGSTGNTAYLASTHATGIDANTVVSLVSATDTADRVAGDCLWCHASHGSTATYDALLGEYRPTTAADAAGGATAGQYAQACFECHGNSSNTVYLPSATYTNAYWLALGADNVYAAVTDTANARSGHRIQTAGAYYAAGSPLPCYECHNPHGSKNGNSLMISDALGSSLDPKASAVENRYFCFTCHTTLDGATWYGSDGTAMVSVSAGTTAVGLDRTAVGNKLTLSATAPHSRTNTTQGCTYLGCHGSVHNPNGGVSTGGVACYGCHGVYEDNMESGGASAGLSYHHVLGGTQAGDYAFTATSYPSTVSGANTEVYCLSCHVDHDKFYNGAAVDQKGYNLRGSLVVSPAAANSDYNDTDGGICLGCHTTALTKSTGQKTSATESATTPALTLSGYKDKAHDYNVASTYAGASNNTYNANCVKCHNDEEAQKTGASYVGYQTSTYKFGTHYSAENRIAKALGAALAGTGTSTEENLCYACHDGDTANGLDGYGVQPGGVNMTTNSGEVKDQVALTYGHKVGSYSNTHTSDESALTSTNTHVECEDCHNPHAAGKTRDTTGGTGGNQINLTTSPLRGVWGVTTTFSAASWLDKTLPIAEPVTYAVDTQSDYEYQICFKCHSGFNTAYAVPAAVGGNGTWTNWGGSTVNAWTNVAVEFNPNNLSYHPVIQATDSSTNLAARMLAGWETTNQTMTCSDCHQSVTASASAYGPHGSTIRRILRGYWPTDNVDNTAGTRFTAGGYNNANILCWSCHDRTYFLSMTTAHDSRHSGQYCVDCHIMIPHGSKLEGLIGDGDGDMPSRYAWANTETNMRMRGYGGNPTSSSSCGCIDRTGIHPVTNGSDW